jgi:hypothetical protein
MDIMNKSRIIGLNFAASILFILQIVACGGGPTTYSFSLGEPYLRLEENNRALVVSAKTFKRAKGDGPKVTLLGVTHVGEKAFYDYINSRLNGASIVFYEGLVANDPLTLKTPSCQKMSKMLDHSHTATQAKLHEQARSVIPSQNNVVIRSFMLRKKQFRKGSRI